ncbi:transcriptional regulator [Pasteurellaceae bacterium Pebbles2]|nr:transcriptional regulator [Pasteurellaceae bacterium Pebbles2]
MVQLTAEIVDKLIGKRIQIKRRELGYSADQLSEYVGLSQQQLSRYERGVNKINVAHLVNIANFLKTPIEWFFLDCVGKEEERIKNEWEIKWQALSDHQKSTFIHFLDAVREK